MASVHHVPSVPSSFVGRSADLAAVEELITPGRVVTLVGPGGCGKTRLAIRAAEAQLESDWTDGVFWVALEDETDAEQVAVRAAAVLDLLLPAEADPVRALAAGIENVTALIVLDNCEHVLDGAAALITAVLAGCPGVAILATSRAPLGVQGEHTWRVPALDLADALDLFVVRAQAAAGRQGSGIDMEGARRVCDRLDRLPLALELAAGWAGTLSTTEIAASLVDPFPLLEGGSPTAAFRQQTLEGSMRWSYDLLDQSEQTLFRWLSVFEPGFGIDAVVPLATDAGWTRSATLRALRGLVDLSLVAADLTGPQTRYRMLGVIGHYASQRLSDAGEPAMVCDRHLQVFLAYVQDQLPLLTTDKDAWRAAIGAEYANIAAAIEWGLARADPTDGRRLAAGVAWLWHLEARGNDGLRLLRHAAERGARERDALQAQVLLALALVADTSLPNGEAPTRAQEAAEIAGAVGDDATRRLAQSLVAIGLVADDLEAALKLAERVHDESVAVGDAPVADQTRALIGLVHVLRDDFGPAEERLHVAIPGLLGRGDRGIASSALSWSALITAHGGDLPAAVELAQRAVDTAEPLRDVHRLGSARTVLAQILVWQGHVDEAVTALEPLRRVVERADGTPYIPGWQQVQALIALEEGRPEEAVTWCRGRGVRGANPSGTLRHPEAQVLLATALRRVGDPAAAESALGEVMDSPLLRDMPRVRAQVVEQQALLAEETSVDRAIALHHQALRLRFDHELVLGTVSSLEHLARLTFPRGASETGAVLFGAVERARDEAGAVPWAIGQKLIKDHLADPSIAAAVERGRATDLASAVSLASRMRGPRKRPSSGWESLTPTERAVVDLAVSGLSNVEIAERLIVTRGTVKTHLAHVYAKLQVANRTQLAGLATLP